jgi:hypothetical protein
MLLLGTVASSYRAAAATTYELINSTTLTSNTTTVTISSIPTTYTDLVVKVFMKTERNALGWDDVKVRFNGDTGSNYSGRLSWAYSSNSVQQGESGTYVTLRPPCGGSSSPNTNTWGQAELYIANYASTSKFKSTVGHDSSAWLNSADGSGIWLHGNNWLNSSNAITSISFEQFSSPPAQISSGSVFSIYGIKRKS